MFLVDGARNKEIIATPRRFVPNPLKFVEKAIGHQSIISAVSQGGQGLLEITIADPGQGSMAPDAPQITCYVTAPELVQEALAAPLLGSTDPPRCLVIGLRNDSVTCFVNACIQMIHSSIHSMKLFNSPKYRALIVKDQLSRAMFDTLDSIRTAAQNLSRKALPAQGVLYPRALIDQLYRFHMSPCMMGDAYELLLLILDHISLAEIGIANASEFTPPNRDTTAIDQIFGQLQRTTISCKACNKNTVRYSVTRSLQLPLTSTLYGSMKKYFKSSEVNGYLCEKCNQRSNISMSHAICNVSYVVLFCISRWDNYGRKNTQPCNCPLEIDLSKGMTQEIASALAPKSAKKGKKKDDSSKKNSEAKIFSDLSAPLSAPKTATHRLVAMINHHGYTMDSGHYTAFVRDIASGSWYLTNDSTITSVSEADVLRGTDAYVLMYERKNITARESSSGVTYRSLTTEHDTEQMAEAPRNAAYNNSTGLNDHRNPRTSISDTSQCSVMSKETEQRHRQQYINISSRDLNDILYQDKPETWDGGSLPADILAAKAPNGELALTSDYLHREPDEMDAEIDRGRRRKNKEMRSENYRMHMEEAQRRRFKRTKEWQKKTGQYNPVMKHKYRDDKPYGRRMPRDSRDRL